LIFNNNFKNHVIPKRPDNNPHGPNELAIIELQGDLEVEGGEGLTNKFMGDIHFSQDVI
jgi:hypothetical protein